MELKEALAEIYKAAHKEFNFKNVPSLHLRQDEENAQGIFGKTAYYDPSDMAVVLYIKDRHPKDICRCKCHPRVLCLGPLCKFRLPQVPSRMKVPCSAQ